MKDVVTCDKHRIGGNNLWPGDLRMGQPSQSYVWELRAESIGAAEQTGGIEISQYPQEEKVITISWVVTSEKERA